MWFNWLEFALEIQWESVIDFSFLIFTFWFAVCCSLFLLIIWFYFTFDWRFFSLLFSFSLFFSNDNLILFYFQLLNLLHEDRLTICFTTTSINFPHCRNVAWHWILQKVLLICITTILFIAILHLAMFFWQKDRRIKHCMEWFLILAWGIFHYFLLFCFFGI